jgi:molybdopterin molybdotransferase
MALSVEDASAQILAGARALPPERVRLADALGRVLAADVRSTIAHPPWVNSSMDGYAVRASDLTGVAPSRPVTLPVTETVRAGQHPSAPLRPGSAVRIMTGAPVPEGADSVIRVEDTDGGEHSVSIRNLRPRGEDLQPGDVAVPGGTVLAAPHIGVLASVGMAMVEVHRRPRVAILTSGDELVDVDRFDEVERGDRIVSSNSYTLRAAAAAAGADVVDLGIVGDDRDALASRLAAAAGCDLLLTSGGVSVGAFDFTKEVLRDLGAELHLWRVKMRPGAPVGFGTLHGMPWLGLPGNPVSTLVTFELFARPLIKRLRGERRVFRRPTDARTREELRVAAPLTHFFRGMAEWEADGVLGVRLTGPQGSGLLTSMARANALVIVPGDRPVVAVGESVRVLLLNDDVVSLDTLSL